MKKLVFSILVIFAIIISGCVSEIKKTIDADSNIVFTDMFKGIEKETNLQKSLTQDIKIAVSMDKASIILGEKITYSAIRDAQNTEIKTFKLSYDGLVTTVSGIEKITKTSDFLQLNNVELVPNAPSSIGKFRVQQKLDSKGVADDLFPYISTYYLIESMEVPSVAGRYKFTAILTDKDKNIKKEYIYINILNTPPVFSSSLKQKKSYVVDNTTGKEVDIILSVSVRDVNGWNDIEAVYADATSIYPSIGRVDMNDQGENGDAQAKNGVYTGVIKIPFYIEGDNLNYDIPITIVDKSGAVTTHVFTLEMINPKNLPTVTPEKLQQLLEPHISPSKLIIFDGRKADGCTSDMEIEITGGINGWTGGTDWRMTKVSDKIWMKFAYVDEGTYKYRFRKYGDWSKTWNQEGVAGGIDSTLTVTLNDYNISKLIIFDGRKAEGCTSNTAIEISGTINGTNGNQKMIQIADKVWVYYAYLKIGTYNYKFINTNDATQTWNQEGEINGDSSRVLVTHDDVKSSIMLIFNGENAEGCTEDTELELSNHFNNWVGGTDWRMTPIGNKRWIYFGHLTGGSFFYRFQKKGDANTWWNDNGELNKIHSTYFIP